MVVSFIFAYIYMERIEATQVTKVELLNKSAADFSVVLMGVPLSATEEQIKSEINRILDSDDKLSQFEGRKNPNLKNEQTIAKINFGIPVAREEPEEKKNEQKSGD